MASIRIISAGGKEYIQVVTYESSPRGQRIKILKSFGPNTPGNMIEAKVFKANFDLLETLKEDPSIKTAETMSSVEKIAGALTGAILGWKVLDYLFKKKSN
jgi:hypothetical protein